MDIFDNSAGRRNGVIECGCGRTYTPHDDEDVREHAEYHAEFERVCRAKNYVPATYRAQERLKDAGREALRDAVTDGSVLAAVELLIRAWFDRSLTRAIEHGFGDLHPTLPEYSKMIAEAGQLDARARDVVASVYRHLPEPPGMVKSTRWDPAPWQIALSTDAEATVN